MELTESVRRYVDAFNDGDWERIRSLFTPDADIRGVLGWGGLEVALPIWRELHTGLSMRLRIENVIRQGQTVAALLQETGRFTGYFRGLADHPPTGKSYEIVAIEWFEFAGDKIAKRWAARDSASITRQVLG